MNYLPGTHIIASLQSGNKELILIHQEFRDQVNRLIHQHDLQKLGEVYHDFSPGGFTAVICLSESHISIHTWPEHNLINLDIYLSNFKRNNDGTVDDIYKSLITFFQATVSKEQIIVR